MAHTLQIDTFPAAGVFNRLRQGYASLRTYLAIREELDNLTDRDLADLGVSRLNIRDVAREAAYGRL